MDAFDIACRDLRACFGEEGIFAGLHQFNDYWARDSFFASLGAIELNEYEIVKKNLQLFLKYEKNGQLPLRIGKNTFAMISSIFLKVNAIRKPIYDNDKSKSKSIDQNSLFIITLYNYITKTNDTELFKENSDRIKRIIDWNLRRDIDNDSLIEEDAYSGWADSIAKKGKVLYTNVCYCHALKCYFELSKNNEYLELHNQVKKKINELFWSGEHYIDWIDENNHYNYFSTDGNMLAIIWEIADPERSRHIEEACHMFDINEIPSLCVHPNYPNKLVYLPLRIIGLKDYHNGISWLWLGAINALAKQKIGMNEEAKMMITNIGSLIERYGMVYEVYYKGKPVNRIFYKSERPFAWSAGLFIYAYNKVKNQ